MVERLRAAVVDVAALGVPETVVHGDLHPGNVARTGRGLVLFDWSDGCIGSPLVEIGAWAAWYEHDPAAAERLWEWYGAAWEREFGIDIAAIDRASVEIVVGAFHAVSYVRIIESQEPLRHDELFDGLRYFLRRLLGERSTRS